MTTWSPTSLFQSSRLRLGEVETHPAKGVLQHNPPETGHHDEAASGPLRAHFRTHAPQQRVPSFDVFVGAGDAGQTAPGGQSLGQPAYRQICGTLGNDLLQ
jgi:hypothetical protein